MDTDPAPSDTSERESDKLLSRVAEEAPNGQRYVHNADCNRSPQHTAGFSGNVQGDHMSTTSHSTKQSDFQQLRIVEGAQIQSSEKTSNIKRKILKFAVSVMFLTMAVGVVAIWAFHDGGKVQKQTKFFSFDEDDLLLNVEIADDYDVERTLSGFLGGVVFTGNSGTPRQPEKCKKKVKLDNDHCLYWDEGTTLKVKLLEFDNGAQCYTFMWENISVIIPQDCYYLRHGEWFGMLSFSSAMWPINSNIPTSIYGPGLNKKLGNVPQYYWLSTSGSAIYVMEDSPIQISWNNSSDMKFCLSPLVSNYPDSQSTFSYSVCQGSDMKHMHTSISEKFFPHLTHSLNRTSDNWSSTAAINWNYSNSSTYFNKNNLIHFLTQLKQNGFLSGTIDIGSELEKEYGDLMVLSNNSDNLDLVDISESLKSFKYVISINPVCSLSSKAFSYGLKNNLFIKDPVTGVTKLIKFQGSDVALWNIYDSVTKEWLRNSILNLTSKMSVRYLKFSAIDTSALSLEDQMTNVGSKFYQLWSEMLSKITEMPILETTFRSQDIPAFIEMNANIVNINNQHCLSYSLPATLSYGLFGYPFVISNINSASNLSDELFIRWFQLSLFLPAFSIPSMLISLKQETIDYTKNATSFRHRVINPRLQSLLTKVSEINPIIKPLWWMDGSDKKTFSISDQFLFGDNILVAPVLCTGSRSRDIYLPQGLWLYPNTNVIYTGKQWLRNFQVSLFNIAYFILQEGENQDNFA